MCSETFKKSLPKLNQFYSFFQKKYIVFHPLEVELLPLKLSLKEMCPCFLELTLAVCWHLFFRLLELTHRACGKLLLLQPLPNE